MVMVVSRGLDFGKSRFYWNGIDGNPHVPAIITRRSRSYRLESLSG